MISQSPLIEPTSVCIVGAGPAGLLLSQLLSNENIPNIVLDSRDRAHIEGRIRAGVLEPATVQTIIGAGVGDRLVAEGLPHEGFDLQFDGQKHRVDLKLLTGRHVTIYGQTELTKDLFESRFRESATFHFDVTNVGLHEVTTSRPQVTFQQNGQSFQIDCEFIAGCDGFHGVSKGAIPSAAFRSVRRDFTLGWIGLLADQPPVQSELLYINDTEGFALCSMRSPSRSRYYLQCAADDTADVWSDACFWDTLAARLPTELSVKLQRGPSIEKSVTKLRSEIVETMQYGNLFLAGDVAHIVPPTGAKGLNLAVADVKLLAQAFEVYYRQGNTQSLERYAQIALHRVKEVERFSSQLTHLMHSMPRNSDIDRKQQQQNFDEITRGGSAERKLAEGYVGLTTQLD